jgi:hypothetical protein
MRSGRSNHGIRPASPPHAHLFVPFVFSHTIRQPSVVVAAATPAVAPIIAASAVATAPVVQVSPRVWASLLMEGLAKVMGRMSATVKDQSAKSTARRTARQTKRSTRRAAIKQVREQGKENGHE